MYQFTNVGLQLPRSLDNFIET